jgi:hypothetical protein
MKDSIKAFVFILGKKTSRLADALLENTMPGSGGRSHVKRPSMKKRKKGKR